MADRGGIARGTVRETRYFFGVVVPVAGFFFVAPAPVVLSVAVDEPGVVAPADDPPVLPMLPAPVVELPVVAPEPVNEEPPVLPALVPVPVVVLLPGAPVVPMPPVLGVPEPIELPFGPVVVPPAPIVLVPAAPDAGVPVVVPLTPPVPLGSDIVPEVVVLSGALTGSLVPPQATTLQSATAVKAR